MGVVGLPVCAGETGEVWTRKSQRSAPAEAGEVARIRGSISFPTSEWHLKVCQLDGLDRRARLLLELVEGLDGNVAVLCMEEMVGSTLVDISELAVAAEAFLQ